MSIWNKILIGLIAVASLAFFYLALRALKTHEYWGSLARRFEQRLEEVRDQNRALASGVERDGKLVEKGIRQYQWELAQRLRDRGRAWFGCTPQQPNAQTGTVTVAIDQPNPHGITVKTALYVFEEAEVLKGGQYLGEFQVDQVAEKQIVLRTALTPLSANPQAPARELQRLAQSKGPWTLYATMPIDHRDVFADLTADQKKKLLPALSVADYLQDGQPATWQKIQQWGVEGVLVDANGKWLVDAQGKPLPAAQGAFARQLRDYAGLFKRFYTRRVVLMDLIESMRRDQQYIQAALDDAKRQLQFTKTQQDAVKTELAKYRDDIAKVTAHEESLKKELAKYRAAIGELVAQNQAMASQLARIQWDATRRIDERTRSMAQSGKSAD